MSLETVKETDTSKISFLKTDNTIQQVHKEFYNSELLENELTFLNLLKSSVKAERNGNTLIYPYYTCFSSLATQPTPEPRALQLMEKSVDILEEFKNKNVIHRDIKPGNLYLCPQENVRVSDFESSIIKKANDSQKTTGTPGYMAPEQYLSPNVDWLADQYSLGAVFYKILTGAEAFDASSRSYESQNNSTPDPSRLNPKLKVPFSHLVQKMMSPQKTKRFNSIAEIRHAISLCQQSLVKSEILEDKVIKIVPKQGPKNSSSRAITYIILFLIVLIAAILLKSI